MSELNRCSPVSSTQSTSKRVIARPSSGFVESWLGCGHASWSLRKRLIAVLRRAHRVLGAQRKKLALGTLGSGVAVSARIVLAVSASAGLTFGAISSAQAAQAYVGGLFAAVGYGSGGGPGSTTMACKDLVYQANGQAGPGVGGGGDTQDGPGGTNTSLNYYGSNVICGSSDAATQTNRILVYADNPTSNATNMTIGGKLYVNGTATVNNLVVTGTTTFNGAVSFPYFHANSTLPDGSASGANSIAIGPNATASHANSLALGNGSATTVGAQTGYTAYGLAATQNSSGELNIGTRKITGVAAGSAPADAVNVSQLNQIAQNTATSLGGGAAYNAGTGAYTAPSYTLSTGAATDVGTAFGNVDTKGTKYFRVNSAGAGSQAIGSDSVAIGPGSATDNSGKGAVAIGSGSFAASGPFAHAAVAVGQNAKSNYAGGVAIGNNAQTSGGATFSSYNAAIGDDAVADSTGFLGGDLTAVGGGAKATVSRATAIGAESIVNHRGATAVGALSSAAADYAVALGAESTADRPNTVSVGTDTYKRQIANVAAGTQDTDAVNVQQLKGAGLKIDANGTPTNAFVAYDGTAKDTVTLGGTSRTKITNVAAGSLSTSSTDAVNGTQLNATNQNLADLGTQINRGAVGLVQQPGGPGNNLTVGAGTNGGAVDFKGTAGNRRLINVAAGTLSATSTDAVNGSQLIATNSATATALGGGAAVNAAGALTAPRYALSTGTVTNVGAALSNVDTIGTKYFRANSSGANSNSTGLDAVAVGPASTAAGNSSIAVGNGAQGLSDDSIAIGRNSTAGGGQSISIGVGNSAFGNGALTLGDPNDASGTGALALGANNIANSDGTNTATVTNQAQGAVALGNQNVAVGQGSVAIGNTSKANNAGSVAIGDSAAVSNAASQGVALGSGATVTHARSVALGAGSATTVGAEAGYVGYGLTASQTSAGEVNIGNRKLTGVAAGSVATDAVNVSQLNQIAQNTATSFGGGAAYNAATGVYTPPRYSIASISATGASTGSTTQTNVDGALTALGTNVANVAGIAVKYDSAGGSIITLGATGGTGAPASGVRITNLTAGALSTASTDAVNGAQLFTTNQNLTSLSNQINSGSVGLVQQPGGTGSNLTVGAGTAGEAVDFKGTAGNRKLIDVAAGTLSATSTDAVIGSQLFATNQNVATNTASIATLGQNALQWDPALRAFSAVHGSTTPQKITNVAAGTLSVTATDAVNGSQLFTTNQNVTNLSNQISSGAVGLVQQPGGPGNNLTVGAGTDGGVVDFKGTAGNRKLIDVAAGTLSATSTDAVNGSQLFATNQSIAAVGQNALQWDSTMGAFSAVHGSAVPRKITNLAAGTLSATSTDAVNGSQLFTTNQTVTTLGSGAASALGGTTFYNPLTGQLTGGFAYRGSSFGSVQSVFDAINTSINGGAGIKYVHVASTKADSQATGTDSIGIGPASVASGGSSIAIGNGAQGQSTNAIAFGTSATAGGGAAVSIGAGNSAFGNGAVALGNTSAANNAGSIAVGDSANVGATASKGVALGSGSSVTGANSVAIGAGSTDGGQANVVSFGAVGAERKIINVADGTLSANSTEVVNGRQLFQSNRSVASLATQINNGSVGLVRQAAPGADLTVGAMTDGGAVNFQGSAGDRKLTHVAAGAVSAASTDAVNGAQLNATNQAVAAVNKLSVKYVADSNGNPTNTVTLVGAGNGQAVKITNVANGVAPTDAVNVRQLQALGASQISYDTNPDGTQNHTSLTFNRGGAAAVLHNVGPAVLGTDAVNLNQLAATAAADRSYTDTQVGGLRNDMSRGFAMLDNRISGVQKEERQGIAAAMAMTSSPMPSAPGKTTWAANTALFKREVGIGASFAHRFATAIPIAFTGGVSWAGNDNLGGRVGLMGEF
ncbi:beta strand repeat-containing protein [Bradyrhizobium brasilense]|uniref:beta strand repeat-containing protein n=1 Tax=Bradyrhizobium brasilense TaxID=1419277 RepID=UPI001E34567E|nr:hypothetical protein [Bradyrhizobium brasilense]MCC8969635.1 hypothetical protein [Bradyrhizobium brasilense]